MHSKTVIWIAFAVWSLICWRWYVCGIKEQCGAATVVATSPRPEPTPPPDTAALEPAPPPAASGKQPASSAQRQTTLAEDRTDAVQVVELQDRVEIHFPYNSVQKEENAAIDAYLNRLAEALRNSGGKVSIAGHTDGIGEASGNKALSLARAKNIRRILVAKGVDAKQITVAAYGESKRVASDDTPAGRYKNRRVVIRVTE